MLRLPFSDFESDKQQYVQIFDLRTHEWRQQEVHGAVPSKCRGSLYAVVGNALYLYGGSNEGEAGNSLYVLDLEMFQWSLIPESFFGRPSAKCLGGMVSFGNRLVTFGGTGPEIGFTDTKGAKFIHDKSFGQTAKRGWNNALHEFDIGTGEHYDLQTVAIAKIYLIIM